MFAHAASSYPSPTLYSHAPYIVASPVPTARERYLRAVADAQAARARYMSELEELHILARLRQQEALRQAEDRQRQMLAFQNELTRRRLGRIHAENLRRPVVVPQVRRPAFARQQRASFRPASKPETPLDGLEAFFAALLRDNVDEAKPQDEKARPEQAEKANVPDDSACFLRKLETALEAATQTAREPQQSRPAGNVPPTTPVSHTSRVPLIRRAEIPRNHLARDRAARTIQQRWRSRSADAAARNDAVATIATLRARFQFLRDTFSFPEHLEFKEQDQEENMDTTPTLLFTPANAAVHTYIHELTKLLTLADAVSSRGSQRVREERRSFVRLVEEALDTVERRVATVWGKKENATVTPSEGADALVTSSTTVPILNTPQCAGQSGARSPGSGVFAQGGDATMIDAEPRTLATPPATSTTTPIIDPPQPAGGSVSQSSGVTLSVQGGGATTTDAEPRVSDSELASCHDSDALTDVSTIIPSRAEMINKHKEAVPADVIDAGDDGQASQWPVRDVVGEDTSSLLEDDRDLGRLPAQEEGVDRQGHGVTTEDTRREDEDEAVQVRLDSAADAGEAAASEDSGSSRAFASAPSPSPLSGSSQLDSGATPPELPSLVAEGEIEADEHGVTPVSAPASGSPAARDAAMAMESFDVVYPDSSSSSVAVEDDAGARDAKGGDGEDEGFELV